MKTRKAKLIHSRVLIKLSGEALADTRGNGLQIEALKRFAKEFVELKKLGVEIAIVIGGGNFLRGENFSQNGFDRVTADQMGILFTVVNGLALRSALLAAGIEVELFAAIAIPGIVDIYHRQKALQALEAGRILILTAGVGLPFVSTDMAASLRAIELNADIILKASTVDGVYTADPKQNKKAKRYDHLSYEVALQNKLRIMDLSAIHLCQDHDMPIRVFDMNKPSVLKNIVQGLSEEGTLISN